jgi:hypothetical protein
MNDLANHDVAIMIELDLRGKLGSFGESLLELSAVSSDADFMAKWATLPRGLIGRKRSAFSLRSGRWILPVRFQAASTSNWQVRIIPDDEGAFLT